MNKDLLLCVPYTLKKEKELKKKGSDVFKCDKKDEKKIADKLHKCLLCPKSFKDERSLKIHKTKMNHWESVSSSMFRSPYILKTQDSNKKDKRKITISPITTHKKQKMKSSNNSH